MTAKNLPVGAWIENDQAHFRLWAPDVSKVDLILMNQAGETLAEHPMTCDTEGYFTADPPGVTVGTRYKYRPDDKMPFPDPASRYQPEGVHGPSEVVNPIAFVWTDQTWQGHDCEDLIVYELHVGTFSPEGTFQGVTRLLPTLRDLGVTVVELMPIGDFPGERNWGYDGVAMFAPARCYGTIEDLQNLVNTAHQLGLSVFLDVVYNHFGPDGNYTGVYTSHYLSKVHHNPWGNSLNFDGAGAEHVRAFFISNAIYWLTQFHFDGLRLDATHAIPDFSAEHFLAQLTREVREAIPDRQIHLIAEDHRNLKTMLQTPQDGGWGLDGVWADDFHHEVRSLLAGDNEGYYRDFRGTVEDLATILNKGWLYCGQRSIHLEESRGTDPTGLFPEQFVICIQNHDQIGNRAFGERLHHQIDLAAYRVASMVLLTAPQTPLLFMGQEWATKAPFRFFTDHNAELGKLVTEGRRKEFRHFSQFTDPAARDRIPDPQAEETFTACKLDWTEKDHEPHAGIYRLYTDLLHLRSHVRGTFQATAHDDSTLVMRWKEPDETHLLVARLKGQGTFTFPDKSAWNVVLQTEDIRYATDAQPVQVEQTDEGLKITFARPSAVLLWSGSDTL